MEVNAVQEVPSFNKDSEKVLTIESLFHSERLHHNFRKFLALHWQSVPSLNIVHHNNLRWMNVVTKTAKSMMRPVCVYLTDKSNGHEIKSSTAINLSDNISVLQVVLMFTSSQNYPYYTLELKNNSRLELCCRKRLDPPLDTQDFHELITGLANTADQLEETMMPVKHAL